MNAAQKTVEAPGAVATRSREHIERMQAQLEHVEAQRAVIVTRAQEVAAAIAREQVSVDLGDTDSDAALVELHAEKATLAEHDKLLTAQASDLRKRIQQADGELARRIYDADCAAYMALCKEDEHLRLEAAKAVVAAVEAVQAAWLHQQRKDGLERTIRERRPAVGGTLPEFRRIELPHLTLPAFVTALGLHAVEEAHRVFVEGHRGRGEGFYRERERAGA